MLLSQNALDLSGCAQAAFQQGKPYFSLQGGSCYGQDDMDADTLSATWLQPSEALWSEGGEGGSFAQVNTEGSLVIVAGQGATIFSTDNPDTTTPSNYMGCYTDTSNRAVPNQISNSSTVAQCADLAEQRGFSLYAIQDTRNCMAGNDMTSARKYGKASNCVKQSDGTWIGSGWSNALYHRTAPESLYYLQLDDDGTMTLARGTGPQDNQGVLWKVAPTTTTTIPLVANPEKTASQGKVGRPFLLSNEPLLVGDFLGSPTGTVYLQMESEGRLCLRTSVAVPCTKDSHSSGFPFFYQLDGLDYKGAMAFVTEDALGVPTTSTTSTATSSVSTSWFASLMSGGDTVPPPLGLPTTMPDDSDLQYQAQAMIQQTTEKYQAQQQLKQQMKEQQQQQQQQQKEGFDMVTAAVSTDEMSEFLKDSTIRETMYYDWLWLWGILLVFFIYLYFRIRYPA
jgi:hypothetical protein